METAWLASQLLDGVSKGDRKRVSTVAGMVNRLEARADTFDSSTQERAELLGAIATGARSGFVPPAHLELLRHLARALLVQSVHGAA